MKKVREYISETAAAQAAAIAISKKRSGNYDKEGFRKTSYKNPDQSNVKSNAERAKELKEDLRKWFKEKWVRFDTKGNIKGQCAREPGEGKPKCLPLAKAQSLGKEKRASAAQRKRREDPNAERTGKAINVRTEEIEVITEKNVPNQPEKWAEAKAQAKKKFSVYPSAYANGWAAKKYKEMGGTWRTANESKEYDEGEYDQEGDMAKTQLRSIIHDAKELHDMLEDNENLPEWVQSKITLAQDYISTVHDYMGSKQEESVDLKVGDKVHAGYRYKGGMGFKGTVHKVEPEHVYINVGKDKYGDRIIKASHKVVTKESIKGVAESSDKLQGTPVVSLSDFGDKDNTKDKYGRTVPKKLKKDDPRVKFHKEPKKQGVAEGTEEKGRFHSGAPKTLVKAPTLVSSKKDDIPFKGPYSTAPGEAVKDKSGAVHTPLSRAKHIAKMAMAKQMKMREQYPKDNRNVDLQHVSEAFAGDHVSVTGGEHKDKTGTICGFHGNVYEVKPKDSGDHIFVHKNHINVTKSVGESVETEPNVKKDDKVKITGKKDKFIKDPTLTPLILRQA